MTLAWVDGVLLMRQEETRTGNRMFRLDMCSSVAWNGSSPRCALRVVGTEQCGAGDGVVLHLPFLLAPQRGHQGQGAIDQNYGVVCTRLVRLPCE